MDWGDNRIRGHDEGVQRRRGERAKTDVCVGKVGVGVFKMELELLQVWEYGAKHCPGLEAVNQHLLWRDPRAEIELLCQALHFFCVWPHNIPASKTDAVIL